MQNRRSHTLSLPSQYSTVRCRRLRQVWLGWHWTFALELHALPVQPSLFPLCLCEHACWIMNVQRSPGGFSLIPGQSGTDRSEPSTMSCALARVTAPYSAAQQSGPSSCFCFPPPNRNRTKHGPGGQKLPVKAFFMDNKHIHYPEQFKPATMHYCKSSDWRKCAMRKAFKVCVNSYPG